MNRCTEPIRMIQFTDKNCTHHYGDQMEPVRTSIMFQIVNMFLVLSELIQQINDGVRKKVLKVKKCYINSTTMRKKTNTCGSKLPLFSQNVPLVASCCHLIL